MRNAQPTTPFPSNPLPRFQPLLELFVHPPFSSLQQTLEAAPMSCQTGVGAGRIHPQSRPSLYLYPTLTEFDFVFAFAFAFALNPSFDLVPRPLSMGLARFQLGTGLRRADARGAERRGGGFSVEVRGMSCRDGEQVAWDSLTEAQEECEVRWRMQSRGRKEAEHPDECDVGGTMRCGW